MADKALKIPFDSLCLASVVAEAQEYVGGRVQGVRQPTDTEISLGIYAGGKESMLLLSCHPQFARAHFVTRRPSNQPQPPALCQAVRARVEGASVVSVRQIGFDRILIIETQGSKGRHLLIAELMGKHSNLILVGEDGRVVSMAKAVGKSKSSRPILSGIPYISPPTPQTRSILEAREGEELKGMEGASPFLLKLLGAMGPGSLAEVQRRVREAEYEPVIVPGHGAYPLSVTPLLDSEFRRPSISVALEQHFDTAVRSNEIETLRQSLLAQLRRVLLAREVALQDLQQAVESSKKASTWQLYGELILAYGRSIEPGQAELESYDYEGNEVRVKLVSEKDWKENANAYFDRAKKAKARIGQVHDQIERLSGDKAEVEAMIERVEAEERLDNLRELFSEARKRRWLNLQASSAKKKEDRPYEGHRIRELVGPQGWNVLYGENSESNDYLTLRVAKPGDYWLHVRGHISAHVVIPTQNHPEKVPHEVILFAAKVAVQNSPTKHSGYVPVDYTLKRYVRKPRGAPKGTALYTHEKTLHVES